MALRDMIDLVDRQGWLDPTAQVVQKVVAKAPATTGPGQRPLKNHLHGVWLGHPLHPVVTDVPLGAWTAALALDSLEAISGREEFGPGADAAILVGLGGAVGAAITGLSDWQYTSDRARRVGLAHGRLNVGATVLYAASLLVRQQGARGAGRGLASLGFSLATAAGYLGGDLSYEQRIRINRAAVESPSKDFVAVLPEAELPQGQLQRVEANGERVLLVRQGRRIHALAETCAHLSGPLAEGRLEDGSIICPWHGSRFAFEDGGVLDGPAVFPQPRFETRVRNGQIEVRATP